MSFPKHLEAASRLPLSSTFNLLAVILFPASFPLISSSTAYRFHLGSHHLGLNYSTWLFLSSLLTNLVHGCLPMPLRVPFPSFRPAHSPFHCTGQGSPQPAAGCALGSACGFSQDTIPLFSDSAMSTPVSAGLLMPSTARNALLLFPHKS